MTTTTSATSSTTVTPTPTPSSTAKSGTTAAISSATQQLLTSLGTGSGVDTGSLVTSLVQAEFAARSDALKTRADTLTAELSGVSTLKSTVSQFSQALDSLASSGSLSSQPVTSDASVLSATATGGGKLSNLNASITVTRLAAAQTAQTSDTTITSRTAKQFTGTLTITAGAATVNADGSVTQSGGTATNVTLSNASLDDVAKAITNSGSGVTASVVTDANGTAFLSIKGKTGAANGFTITTSDDATTGHTLASFAVGDGSGAKATGQAQDAALTVDGISVTRASNTVSDLVDGATLTLAKTGSVQLTSSTPTAALSQAVSNFVDTYNQVMTAVKGLTDPITGALRSDPAARALQQNLQALASKIILPGAAAGSPQSLSEIGVATQRDGTLSVDTDTLTRAMATYPDAVEAMFAAPVKQLDGSMGGPGITAALDAVTTAANDVLTGLTASASTYTAQQTKNSSDQDDLTTKQQSETTRLTQQFANMNSKVSAYKSTQSFLTNQIAAWNKQDG